MLRPRASSWSCCLLLALAACTGGSADQTIDLVFDPCDRLTIATTGEVTDGQLDSVGDAIAMWNTIAGTRLELSSGPEASETPIVWLRFDDAAPAFHGVYIDETGEIIINRALGDRHERAVTVAHELGHAFGVLHISDRSSVMNPGNLDTEPNGADAAEVAAIWNVCSPVTSP